MSRRRASQPLQRRNAGTLRGNGGMGWGDGHTPHDQVGVTIHDTHPSRKAHRASACAWQGARRRGMGEQAPNFHNSPPPEALA